MVTERELRWGSRLGAFGYYGKKAAKKAKKKVKKELRSWERERIKKKRIYQEARQRKKKAMVRARAGKDLQAAAKYEAHAMGVTFDLIGVSPRRKKKR